MSITGTAAEQFHGRPAAYDRPRRAIVPSADAFYVPPPGWAAASPGTVLQYRPVDIAAYGLIRQQVDAWQLLYRTMDVHGRPDAAVVTVLLPPTIDRERTRVLAYQCAIDSVTERGMPSFLFRAGAGIIGSAPQTEYLFIASALERGWVVCVADHGGMAGAFTAAREAGYRALDGVRAALAFDELDLPTPARVGLFGYSGGGMAAAWAAEMAKTYAPELDLVGTVAGSPVGDPAAILRALNGTALCGLAVMGISGLRRAYPAIERAVQTDTNGSARGLLDAALTMSTVTALFRFAWRNVDMLGPRPLEDILAEPDIAAVLTEIRLGTHALSAPIYVLQSLSDQAIPSAVVDAQVERYRVGGAHVTYLRDRWSEHISLAYLALPLMLQWLSDRFDQQPLPAPSARSVRTVLGQPGVLREHARIIRTVGRVLTGRRLRARSAPGAGAGRRRSVQSA